MLFDSNTNNNINEKKISLEDKGNSANSSKRKTFNLGSSNNNSGNRGNVFI